MQVCRAGNSVNDRQKKGYQNQPVPPHNIPFTVIGAGLLWFGWFGFNAGSALAANGLAVNAFVATILLPPRPDFHGIN